MLPILDNSLCELGIGLRVSCLLSSLECHESPSNEHQKDPRTLLRQCISLRGLRYLKFLAKFASDAIFQRDARYVGNRHKLLVQGLWNFQGRLLTEEKILLKFLNIPLREEFPKTQLWLMLLVQ